MGHGERPAAECRPGPGANHRMGLCGWARKSGLVRFDGVEFQTYDRNSAPALPGSDIRSLLAAPDGALWVGTNTGLARWKDGAVRDVHHPMTGCPATAFWRWVKTPMTESSGRLDGAGSGPAWTGDRFAAADEMSGAFPPALRCLRRREFPWSDRFLKPMNCPNGILADGRSKQPCSLAPGSKVSSSSCKSQIWPRAGSFRAAVFRWFLTDREGALWIGTDAGLVRWVKGKVERFPDHRSCWPQRRSWR
jgi:hypothetical protein